MEMLHEAEFWEALGFVLVVALLLWKGVPAMIGKMLDQRATVIAAELDEAKRLSAEATRLSMTSAMWLTSRRVAWKALLRVSDESSSTIPRMPRCASFACACSMADCSPKPIVRAPSSDCSPRPWGLGWSG